MKYDCDCLECALRRAGVITIKYPASIQDHPCNCPCHDRQDGELLAALKRAEVALDSLSDMGIERVRLDDANHRLAAVMEVATKAREEARAAIAKAKGGA